MTNARTNTGAAGRATASRSEPALNHPRSPTIGLVICALLGVLDIVGLVGLVVDDAPPAALVIVSALMGVITLVGVGRTWRRKRYGVGAVVGSRVVSALLSIPVFFVVGAPDWSRVAVGIAIALTAVGVGLMVAGQRQQRPVVAGPRKS